MSTVEPLLTTTSDERPPCLWQTLTLVPTPSLFRIVLKKPLLCGHLSTPYYGHIFGPYHYKITSCYGQLHPLFNDYPACRLYSWTHGLTTHGLTTHGLADSHWKYFTGGMLCSLPTHYTCTSYQTGYCRLYELCRC